MPNPYSNAGPTPPRITGAETNADGTQVILSVNKDVMTPASSEIGNFDFTINTITQTSPFTAISLDGTSTIVLELATSVSIEAGDVMSISYTPGTIQSTEDVAMESFSNQTVTNRLAGNSTLVDDCEDMDNLNELGGAWFTYTDVDNAGTSTIDPQTSDTVDFTMTEDGANGSGYAAEVTYTLGETWGTDDNDPFVGIGTQLGEDETPMDISGATGISFYHKGDACVLEIYLPDNLGTDANYDTYAVPVSSHTDWTKVELAWSDFSQAGWGDSYDLDLTEVYKFQWKISDEPTTAGAVAIDYVVLEGLAGGSTPTVDKSGLVAAISTAEDNIATAVPGTDPGNYPQTAIDDLQTAVDAAQLVAADSEADQATVDQAETDLLAAIDVFNAAQIEPSTTLIASNELASTELLTYWFTYTDVDNSGLSTVTPANGEQFNSITPGADGTDSAAQITYELDQGDNTSNPFVGLGFNTKEVETESFDFSGTDGISFYHKGDACDLEVSVPENMGTAPNYDTYYVSIPAHTSWTKVSYNWTDFAQHGWGDEYTFDISQIYKFQWKVEGDTGDVGDVALDQVAIVGGSITLPTVPEPVDKSALTTLIAEANTLHSGAVVGTEPGQYPSSAKTAFGTAITTAETVEADDAATQAEVDQAVIDLQDAIDTFEASVNPELNIDVTALETAIADAEAVVNVNVGSLPGQHPVSAQTTLQAAIDDAQALADNPTTQEAVNTMVISLEDAVATFENTVNPEADKSVLTALIADANTLYSGAVVGTDPGQYPSSAKTTFGTAITTAEAVEADDVATQAEVDLAVSDLQDAIDTFEASVNPELNIDVTALDAKIADAHSTLSLADIGTAEGQHPQSAADDLQTAIDDAQTLVDNPTTQSAVDAMVTTLNDAITTFENTTNPSTGVDKDALQSIISSAESTLANADEGTADGQYEIGSKNDLQNGIDIAKTVFNDANATQAEVDQAVRDLENALDVFQSRLIGVDKSTLQSLVSSAESLYNSSTAGTTVGTYPQLSMDNFQYAINNAKVVLINSGQTQAEVDQAVDDLQDAIDVFEASQNPEVVSKSELSATIAQARMLYDNAVVGDGPGEYPLLATHNFISAIEDAQDVYDDETVIQMTVNQTIRDLEDAIATFEAAQVDDYETAVNSVTSVDVMVYPNPCVSVITVDADAEIASVMIVSRNGSVVQVANPNQNSVSLDVAHLAQGTYFVNIEYAHGFKETVKVLKK
ncbi:MAG: carbohydrate binding domain-containing protein [Bacteroidales bacterium]